MTRFILTSHEPPFILSEDDLIILWLAVWTWKPEANNLFLPKALACVVHGLAARKKTMLIFFKPKHIYLALPTF